MENNTLAPESIWDRKIYSGTWVAPAEGGELHVIEKASGETLGVIGQASAADVSRATRMAKDAQREWARVPGPERGDVLRKFAALLPDHADEIAALTVRETGSIGAKGQWEVVMSVREAIEAANIGSEPVGYMTATSDRDRRSFAKRVPVGTVGIITPWNSPFLLALRQIAPALAAGNAVIVKPDPQTPICGGAVLAQLFEAAGLPEGLLHILPGGVETGEAVVADPLVDLVTFTGGIRGGRQVGAKAGELLKKVVLELGGNNPYVVLPGVDIEAAASAGAWGSFFHQGQICLSTGRHIVHEDIADDYVAALTKHAEALAVGDPRGDVHLGPIVNERQAANVDRIVAQTVNAGATLVTGGRREGLLYTPTVLTGVKAGMPCFDEEIFGPVAPITTFASDDEAVALANDTAYGLSAGVVGPDLARAQRIAEQLHAGIVHVNDQPVLHEVYGPIGGVGISGNGSAWSTLTNTGVFTEWKWMTVQDEIPAYPF
ncbi:aldehyde dehydrogenase family protein [Gordonia sp. HNM0687]|uniref:Aldehyde dehydrogenase family protein n=1 Tax=Gordonia mangrovi TaxID=2665643 RepID=A0A6L7GTT8_9ACTN|nr:aldehyde dehydrogenase family protein [Gordonia mangrovi]MXP23429.1 aldehyde dehydrogenase family protein [Gordonia mangrovi]UVF76674.1 aldehyde dehydrogenase family protein [Gordonia mangrovi]